MSTLRLAFAGTPDFAARHLQALLGSAHKPVAVLTQPDRRAGRGKKAQAGPVKRLALEHGLPVLQPPTLRDDKAQEEKSEDSPKKDGQKDGIFPSNPSPIRPVSIGL